MLRFVDKRYTQLLIILVMSHVPSFSFYMNTPPLRMTFSRDVENPISGGVVCIVCTFDLLKLLRVEEKKDDF